MKSFTILLGLLLATTAIGEQAWEQLAVDGASAGLDAERFQDLVGRCRDASLSAEDTRSISRGLFHACAQDLPIDSVYAKIDEGLAKHASAKQISRATGIRVQKLERADMLVQTHRADDPRGRPALIEASAHALESGVSESGVARLLSDPNSDRPGWLMGAIEGLETLHAQGFPDADAERLMVEALSSGMRRNEILQAIDLALRNQREGMDAASIRLETGTPTRGGGRGNGGPRRPR